MWEGVSVGGGVVRNEWVGGCGKPLTWCLLTGGEGVGGDRCAGGGPVGGRVGEKADVGVRE